MSKAVKYYGGLLVMTIIAYRIIMFATGNDINEVIIYGLAADTTGLIIIAVPWHLFREFRYIGKMLLAIGVIMILMANIDCYMFDNFAWYARIFFGYTQEEWTTYKWLLSL